LFDKLITSIQDGLSGKKVFAALEDQNAAGFACFVKLSEITSYILLFHAT